MAKKITQEEFLYRFKQIFPQAKIKILEYTAISKPCTIQCLKCKKVHHYKKGNDALNRHFCCQNHTTKLENIKKRLIGTDYSFVKQIDKDNIIIKHDICGQEMNRAIVSAFKQPCSCSYCNSIKFKNMLSKEQAQQKINDKFFNNIILLEYRGYDKQQSLFKCLKCGLIFKQKYTCLLQSRGCPQCDRWKSRGETQIKEILKNNNIIFKEQVSVQELPLQHFDFAVYEDNKIKYFIECQGEQHFEEREIFKDSLSKIQQRDNKKRKYCQQKKIPLYEIIYKKGKLLNLNILPFMKNC